MVNLKETVIFRVEIEISLETFRNLAIFDEIYKALNQEIYLNADLYTEAFDFDDTSEDDEYLQD